jgi:hypothetical protein
MAVLWIERRNGSTTVTRVEYETDKREVLGRRVVGQKAGEVQLSRSNGIIGTKADLRKQMKIDAERGVPIRYVQTHASHGPDGQPTFAWRAEFLSPRHKRQWLRASKRYDADACYLNPPPGTWRDKLPPEF